jgi:hypothetical protein
MRHTLVLCLVLIQHLAVNLLEQRLEIRLPSHLFGSCELVIRPPRRIIPACQYWSLQSTPLRSLS